MNARDIKRNAQSAAKQLLAARLAPVENLASAAANVEKTRKAAADAEAEYAAQYQAARDAGWSAKELAAIGLNGPTSRRRHTSHQREGHE